LQDSSFVFRAAEGIAEMYELAERFANVEEQKSDEQIKGLHSKIKDIGEMLSQKIETLECKFNQINTKQDLASLVEKMLHLHQNESIESPTVRMVEQIHEMIESIQTTLNNLKVITLKNAAAIEAVTKSLNIKQSTRSADDPLQEMESVVTHTSNNHRRIQPPSKKEKETIEEPGAYDIASALQKKVLQTKVHKYADKPIIHSSADL